MEKIQLYSMATPNGQKIGIALEEMGLPYQEYLVNILNGDQYKPEFVAINPNSKIPAIVDPNGPGGKPISVFESGAILVYLAEKSGMFLPKESRTKYETLQWLFFQVGGVGPMFGQFGHFFKYAKNQCDHPYPVERYTSETKRLLGVVDNHLRGKTFLVGEEYTIADMSIIPWVSALKTFYQAEEKLDLEKFKNVMTWLDRCLGRPKTAIGMGVCKI